MLMQIFQTDNDVGNKKFSLKLTKFAFSSYMVSQISTIQVIHHQIKILSVLKRTCHIDKKRMVKLSQESPFIHHRVDRLFINDLGLLHLLHCIDLIGSLAFDLPNFTKASFSNRIQNLISIFPHQIRRIKLRVHLVAFGSNLFSLLKGLANFIVYEQLWYFLIS